MGRARDLERTQRLLRRLDLEEVLEEGLGIDVLWRSGADAYAECPDPEHVDENPSFHVCVEDVEDSSGRSMLGWFNCWSHPDPDGMRGFNFLDLVAKVRNDLWGEREDGRLNWPNDAQRAEAAAWLREEFLTGEERESRAELAMRRRRRVSAPEWRELLFPPNVPIDRAEPRFREYLERREIPLQRARELDVRVVYHAGEALKGAISGTVPGVLFPIPWEGRVVNWFLRGVNKRLKSRDKGRYCPGLPLGKGAGVLWAPDGLPPDRPVVLVEGIFDAERVRALLRREGLERSVAAVLGGRLYPAQAQRLRTVPYLIHLADGDDGGLTLGKTVDEQVGSFTRAEVRQLPEGTDPGDAPEDVLLRYLEPPRSRLECRVRFRRTRRLR